MRGGLGSDRVKDSASEHRAVAKGAKRESRRSENSQILMLPKVRRLRLGVIYYLKLRVIHLKLHFALLHIIRKLRTYTVKTL